MGGMTPRDKRQQKTTPAGHAGSHDDPLAGMTTKARLDTLERDVNVLRRDLAATRAWCIGLEEELGRLRAMLHNTNSE